VGFVFQFYNLIPSLTVRENVALVTDIAKDPMPVDEALVLEVIANINTELGTKAVVITHNAAIAGMADRVIRLVDGRMASIEVPQRRLTPAELSW
jgi:putative ABC transport system ATP-binding protein